VATVYILYSKKLDRFYTGSCKDFLLRFQDHLDKIYPGSFTSNADDWQPFLLIENLTYAQARANRNPYKEDEEQNIYEKPGEVSGDDHQAKRALHLSCSNGSPPSR